MTESIAEQLRRFNQVRSHVIRTVDDLRHETPSEIEERQRREQEIAESLRFDVV